MQLMLPPPPPPPLLGLLLPPLPPLLGLPLLLTPTTTPAALTRPATPHVLSTPVEATPLNAALPTKHSAFCVVSSTHTYKPPAAIQCWRARLRGFTGGVGFPVPLVLVAVVPTTVEDNLLFYAI
ncbi:hypothetical protein N7454_005573 [Penicillium verhagenii]|nr:hypothetical protein N7454_005573 [Penicillium verhagenii]